MSRRIALLTGLAGLALLAACGVDGPPQAPAGTAPGVSVSGEATFGMRTEL